MQILTKVLSTGKKVVMHKKGKQTFTEVFDDVGSLIFSRMSSTAKKSVPIFNKKDETRRSIGFITQNLQTHHNDLTRKQIGFNANVRHAIPHINSTSRYRIKTLFDSENSWLKTTIGERRYNIQGKLFENNSTLCTPQNENKYTAIIQKQTESLINLKENVNLLKQANYGLVMLKETLTNMKKKENIISKQVKSLEKSIIKEQEFLVKKVAQHYYETYMFDKGMQLTRKLGNDSISRINGSHGLKFPTLPQANISVDNNLIQTCNDKIKGLDMDLKKTKDMLFNMKKHNKVLEEDLIIKGEQFKEYTSILSSNNKGIWDDVFAAQKNLSKKVVSERKAIFLS